MKRVLLVSVAALSGCLNFDGLLDAGCAADAAWAECRTMTSDDAGTTDAGTTDGGVCGEMLGNGTWCWENPGPFGAVDLFTVWGTSDTDVWVGGSGGALMHFDGTRWSTSPVSLAPVLALTQPELMNAEPSPRSAAIDDAGVVWLVGEEMKVYALGLDGALVNSYGSRTSRISASSFGGTTWFMSPGASSIELGRVGVGGTPTFPTQMLVGGDNATSLTASASGVFIAYERVSPNSTAVLELPGPVVALQTPNTTDVRNPRTFAQRNGVPMLACSSGDLFERTSGGWTWKGLFPLGEDLRSHAFASLPDGGSRWWVTGGAGVVASLEDFDAGLTVHQVGVGSALYGSWVSPRGHLWAVGADGYVLETELVNGSAVVTPHGALNEVNLVDIATNGNRAVAVGRGGVTFTRDPTTQRWGRVADPRSYDYRAVALGPADEFCTLNLLGHIACNGSDVLTDDLLLADGGLVPTAFRGGAMAIRSDGGAVAAMGDFVLTRSGGAWQRFDAGLTTPHLNDLALTPNGFALVTNQLDANNELVQGALVVFDGSQRTECRAGTAGLTGVSRTDAGFAVVGTGVAGECSPSGQFTTRNAPPGRWVSVWVDANATWWILDDSGVVLRRAAGAGQWVRDRLPLGGSAFDGPSTLRITGDEDEVFVVCKQGGVLRRPLP